MTPEQLEKFGKAAKALMERKEAEEKAKAEGR
jgi:hypothetical protein